MNNILNYTSFIVPLLIVLAIWGFYIRWIYRLAIEADKPSWLWIIYGQLGVIGLMCAFYLYGFVKAKRIYEMKSVE